MKRLWVLSIFGLVLTGAVSAQFARNSTAYVAVKTAQLKSSTGFFARSLGALSYGDQVTVLQTRGKWVEVRSGARSSLSGWINSSNLTSRRITAAGAAASASANEIALAGKSFTEEIENLYRANGDVNYADVDRTETQRVSEQELYAFLTEGHLSLGDAE
ncbi:MAG: hypothetical protein LBG10_03730 [Treponema sp.]|jgi:uncharacterized protein YgiM (DUF1202 family)|nr:hypothetical protein [Treponema sp.]